MFKYKILSEKIYSENLSTTKNIFSQPVIQGYVAGTLNSIDDGLSCDMARVRFRF